MDEQEKKIATAQQNLLNILENIRDGFWVLSHQGDCIYINKRQAEIMGKSKKEIQGQNLWKLFPKLRNTEIDRQFHRVITQQTPINFEYLETEQQRWYEYRVEPTKEGISIFTIDITDRKQYKSPKLINQPISNSLENNSDTTEAVFKKSQELFHCFMEHSPIAAFIKDETGRHIYVNAWIKKLFGDKETDLVGKTDFEIYPLQAAQQFRANDQEVLNRGEAIEFLETIPHQDEEHYYMSFKFPFQDASGRRLLAGIAIDASERIRAEEALRLSDERFRIAARAVNGIVYDWDVISGNVYRSEGLYSLMGVHPDDVPQSRNWWSERIHPDDLARIAPILNSVKESNSDRYEFEYRIRHEDGHWIDVWDRGYLIRDRQGKIIRVVGSTSDISERKQAEDALRESAERLNLALAASKMGDWSWNAKTDLVAFSERSAEIFGIPPGPYMSWTQIRNLLHPEDRERARLAVEQSIREHSDYDIEYRVIIPNGTQRWVAVKGRAQYDASGEILGMLGVVQDISERKRAEEALRETEARLEVALKNSPITVFNQDQELRYTWIYNPAFNYQIEDIIGKREEELFESIDITVLTQIKRRVLETGIEVREEVKIDMPDGEYFYDLTVEPLRDNKNNIIGITCAAIDISERKQIELAIRKSETILNAFLTSSPMAIAFLDQDLRYIYANEALAATNGVSLTEHLGRTVWEVLPEWAPHVQAVVDQVLRSQKPLLNQEVSGETNPPGVYRYGLVNYYPVYLPDGQMLGVGITSMDITELKRTEQALLESEDLYRSLVKASCQIVWRANSRGQFIEVQGWEDFTGQPVEELLSGSTEAIHPDDLERVTQVWWNAVNTKSVYQVEHRIRKYDGTYEYFAIRGIPVLNASGEMYAWVGMTTNIHERKQAEIKREQLLEWERKAREEAERANRIKDEFLAVLSHELRSPLNPILGWTQMLRTYKLDEKATRLALDTIERNAKLQTQLIEDLLDISRILRGKMLLNIAPVNLVSVIESALETVQLAAQAKNISIQRVFNCTIEQVLGDASRLGQIVWNLLSNAVKFTPAGGQITVRLELVDTDVQIQVQDTGQGIKQEFLPYVFEYFRQEDSKTTRKFGGLGLGLAIVRQLTELHGGTVQADSPGEGLGATFTVRLPLTTTQPTTIQDHPLLEEAFDLSQLQILVVDDEPDMQELLLIILERSGAQVKVAASAAEALSLLEQFTPDVLISDIGMPDIDGYMLMQQIKQLPPERRGLIRAIALTAYAGELNKQKAFQAGFQKHLSKPVEPYDLVRTIASLVGRSITNGH